MSKGFVVEAPNDQTSSAVMVDVSDLVCYMGHHDHLTGIQRVQACIVFHLLAKNKARPISFDVEQRTFRSLDAVFFKALLQDFALPAPQRKLAFDRLAAKSGKLVKGAAGEDCAGAEVKEPSIVLLLGAAWVINDYFHHIGLLRDMGSRFICVIHDLIPIFARETCDQGTAKIFQKFLSYARKSTDLFLCVSENTRRDLERYFISNDWGKPNARVIPHATELPVGSEPRKPDWLSRGPNGFVLFVSTIEGRKNHELIFNVWRRLAASGLANIPQLVCIGRPGWRSDRFLIQYVASNGLDGRIVIQSDVADAELSYLYEDCLFTVYPSIYEGWGLPISESLAHGKLCVCSNTSSMPEAGGDLTTYIDPHDVESAYETIRALIASPERLQSAERRIKTEFQQRKWEAVADEYFDAAWASLRQAPISARPHIPGHFVFRAARHDFDGIIGSALLDNVIDHLRSELKPQALSIDDFERGYFARGGGDWCPPEDWGCWIGMKGATLCIEADSAQDCLAYISYKVLPPFRGARLKIVANGTTTFHTANSGDGAAVLVLPFLSRPGKNEITFVGSPTEEQRRASMEIDRRGLMIGLCEIVCLEKADLVARLDLMQAIARA